MIEENNSIRDYSDYSIRKGSIGCQQTDGVTMDGETVTMDGEEVTISGG